MKILRVLTLVIFISLTPDSHAIDIEKKDYLSLIIGNYIHGFKEFDTSITSFDDLVKIGIYYDVSTQNENRAKQLANRFREQIPVMLKQHSWAEGVGFKLMFTRKIEQAVNIESLLSLRELAEIDQTSVRVLREDVDTGLLLLFL